MEQVTIYTSIRDGATPKATRSERESSSMPNLVDVFVNLAIHPSRPSNIFAITIAHAALRKLPFIADRIAKSRQTCRRGLWILGRRYTPLLGFLPLSYVRVILSIIPLN